MSAHISLRMNDLTKVFCIAWAYGYTPCSPEWQRACEVVAEREGDITCFDINNHHWWIYDCYLATRLDEEETAGFRASLSLALEDNLATFQDRIFQMISDESKLDLEYLVKLVESETELQLYLMDIEPYCILIPLITSIIDMTANAPICWSFRLVEDETRECSYCQAFLTNY